MLRGLPCSKETVFHYEDPVKAAEVVQRLLNGCGFAEVDIKIGEDLWTKFEEMPPFFYNKKVSLKAVPQELRNYLVHTGHICSEGRKLLGIMSGETLLPYARLPRCYITVR